MPRQTLDQIISEAISDFEEHGFDSAERLTEWERRIREAIALTMAHQEAMSKQFRDQLRNVFDRLVHRGDVLRAHPGVERYKLQNVAARLHSELERRIMASAQLIKINREEAIQKTIKRFSGWASSVPKGGAADLDKRKLKQELSSPISRLPFVERRVLIDQGHKLNSSISSVLAHDAGAIAAKWLSHWKQAGYDYREDHKSRDGLVYLARDSWARKEGLVKVGPEGYMDDITQPAEEPFCRCKWVYIYHLRSLPEEMLTAKGKEALKKARAA